MDALTTDGAVARFVGGCVRDALLGRPVKDIDIAIAAPPATVTALLEQAEIKAVPTGIAHGTVTAVTGGAHFEITTLRHDVETFGRHARVAFTDDWEADAARRDFTINALFCDTDGTVYDPTGGLADLRAGRVRFVGDAADRIDEDVLRLLRFFRFYAHYATLPPDPDALVACRAHAPGIANLSVERVWSELRRLLAAPDPADVLDLMAAWDVLDHVLPEACGRARLAALQGIEDGQHVAVDPIRRLAAVLEVDAAGAGALARRLRMSNAEAGRLGCLAAPDERPAPGMDEKARRGALHRLGGAVFGDLALLGWAAAVAAGDAAPGDAAPGGDWRNLWRAAAAWQPVSLPVAGRDALALGVARGKPVGKLLAAVEQWWIAHDFQPDRAQCLDKLKQLARKAGNGR